MGRKEVAAGFIVFRRLQQQVQYLLMQTSYGSHHWTPPKGHLEEGETEMDAAVRETEEEAGITKDQLNVHEFKGELRYPVKGQMKRVVYWVAELINPNTPVKLSDEHIKYEWLTIGDSKKYQSQFEDMCALMDQVDEYITGLNK